jgi:Xaa-Pro aminopeptidase
MSLGRYQEYKDVFQVNIDSGEKKKGRIFVYAVEKDGMASAHDQDRAVAQKTALELIDKFSEAKSEDKDLIKKNISASRSDKFALLESLMLKDNLSSVLASSPINIQELAPLPWEELKDGFLALYHNQKAFLLSPEPVENPLIAKKGDYDSLRDALDELTGDTILGVEEKNLDIGRVSEIGWDKVKNATDLFRTWREHSTLSDLPYYVIVGQATRYAMEKAVAFAGQAITAKQKITEKDVEEKFLELVNEFKLKYNCSLFDFKRYFVVLHAGTRTPYASLSSDYLLNAEMNSLKLDAGILILQNGILRGCSDMARSLVLTEEGKKVYLLTERLMLESAIPAAKPGNTGSDVYWAGVSPLVEIEEEIKKWGMLPPAASIKDSYNRDIGHIMAKQEPATIGLVKAETNRRLQAGMIGAVEYQWPYKKHALGIEDLYLVTDKRGIVISR